MADVDLYCSSLYTGRSTIIVFVGWYVHDSYGMAGGKRRVTQRAPDSDKDEFEESSSFGEEIEEP